MISYLLIRLFTFPCIFLSYKALHALGRFLGSMLFYCTPNFKKRALCNLSIPRLFTEEEIQKYARASFQNLVITCLEYAKLDREQNISRVAHCENPKEAQDFIDRGIGVIFFCAHQSNWEILFLEGTHRMPGVAIGRPIKNPYLYQWILKIREKFGGQIIPPRMAVKEGLRALKKGKFLGIVGDQGMPDSGFSSPFFGKNAWTSPLPALLSYKTGSPLFVATTRRVNGKYYIHYSKPILPDVEAPLDQEVERMMRKALSILEKTIIETPGEWLWQHNRWKQQVAGKLKRAFRHESICLILPEDQQAFENISIHLPTFREISPTEFITLYVPAAYTFSSSGFELKNYKNLKAIRQAPERYKLVFNFSGSPLITAHFKKKDAFTVIDLKTLTRLCPEEKDLSKMLKKAILN